MNAQQELYAVAKAQAETVEAEAKRQIAALPALARDCSEAEFEARCYAEEAIFTACGVYPAWDALRAAERALCEWAMAIPCIAARFEKESGMTPAEFLAKAMRRPSTRERLVSLAFRVQA